MTVLNQGYQGVSGSIRNQDQGWGYQGSLISGSQAPLGTQGTSGISGTSGIRIRDGDQTPQRPHFSVELARFMKWTYDFTKGHMIVADLQGIKCERSGRECYILTDPGPSVVLCRDIGRFNPQTNMGKEGIDRCIATANRALEKSRK